MEKTQKTAYLQLHRICDQDCIFCAQPTNGKYLNFWEIQKQIDFYISEWYSEIIFSWWEPSMSPYFFETLEYCKKKNMHMRILTNWHKFMNSEFAKKSIQAWLHSYHISIHSHIESIHDSMVKKQWSYKRSLQAMMNILKYGGKLTVNITVNSYNVKYFPKMIHFFLKNFHTLDGFIINNLETSQITSRYYSVIASLWDIKKIIIPSLQLILDQHKNVRVERVPMCYLRGYEHLSTDVELSLMWEVKYLHYLDAQTSSWELNSDTFSADYTYGKACNSCDLKEICWWIAWLWEHYNEEDLYTQRLTEEEKERLYTYINNFLWKS